MRHRYLGRWLLACPSAVTAAVLGLGIAANAADHEQDHTPNKFSVALLSDTDSEERTLLNTDPGVMGEVELVRERYDDGSIHVERQTTLDREGNYVNHGSWKMFSKNGDVLAEGQYHFGNRVGMWTRWHGPNDAPLFKDLPFKEFKAPFMSQVNFTDGKMDGEWIIMDANDRKVSQISLSDGNRHGLAISWLPNGSTYRQATYEQGQPVGELLEFNPRSGKVERTATYTEGRRIINKVTNHSGRDKAKKSEVLYLGPVTTQESGDDFWNARLAKFADDGKTIRHGLARTWYPDGKPESEGTYQYGKKSGTFTFWHPNGQVSVTGDYRDDQPEGQWVWWHPNGQRSAYGRYQDGQLIGEWRWWNDDGKLSKQRIYDGMESASAEPDKAFDISSRTLDIVK